MGKQVKIVLAIVAVALALFFVYAIRESLIPFLLAFVLAYILAPLVNRMEGRGLNRTLSIIIVFVCAFSGLGLVSYWVGDKLVDQMIDLSGQFLDPETRQKELTIVNGSQDTVKVKSGVWVRRDPQRPSFSWGKPDWPLEVAPEDTLAINLRFTPAKKDSAVEGNLNLYVDGLARPYRLRVGGNLTDSTRTNWRDKKWMRIRNEGALVFSARAIDFGEAGPNIITLLSEYVKEEIQPWLQPVLGEDFELSVWIKETGGEAIQTLLGGTKDLIGGIISGLTFLVIVPFVAFFFLKEGHRITRGLIELVPNAYFELCLNLQHQINAQIGGYIRGQILATSVVATLAVTGLSIIDVKYALPLGIVAGLANMIPFLGPLIGFFSATIVALATVGTEGGGIMVLHVGIVFLVVQLTDNILIQPTVVAKSVDLHPLVVLLVVMIGSQLVGIIGMLIAVPLTGIIKVSSQTIYQGVKSYRVQ